MIPSMMSAAKTALAPAPGRAGGLKGLLRHVPGLRALKDWRDAHKPLLDAGAVTSYHMNGYMVFDTHIPHALIDRAVEDIRHRPEINGKELHHGSRVFDGWTFSRAIRDIALWPRVNRLLRQLYGRTPKPFQTLNFPIGTEQKVHSDDLHFSSDPYSYMCGVWLALEDTDMDNGPLVYYPGSHKLPRVGMEQVAPGPGPQYMRLYEEHMANLVREKALEPHYAILKKGQAIIWAANLLHGGSVHRDKNRTRRSQVTHYFFEGCSNYMPLESYGGYRHLLFPEWVR